jgi:hypothetical protein
MEVDCAAGDQHEGPGNLLYRAICLRSFKIGLKIRQPLDITSYRFQYVARIVIGPKVRVVLVCE